MNRPAPADRAPALDRLGLFNLGLVYVVWGSTYLAIRIAVRPEGGFAPFHLALMRVVAASLLLFAWAALRRHRLLPTRREVIVLAGTGQLMWVGANGLVTWAETHADSGLAALLVAVMPIWSATAEAILDRRMPSPKMIGSLLIGIAGVGVLSWPVIRAGDASDLWAVVALMIAPITWAIASIWMARGAPTSPSSPSPPGSTSGAAWVSRRRSCCWASPGRRPRARPGGPGATSRCSAR